MPAFSQRCPDDLHGAMRAFLNQYPWLSQNELVNGAIATMIGYADYRIDTAPPTLDDYLRVGAMNAVAHDSLRRAIQLRQPIAIVGLPRSGRTSLLRALVHEYQIIPDSPRRAMVITNVAGELTKETPLIAMTVNDHTLRRNGISHVPDVIESIFTDNLLPGEMPAAMEAWSRGSGGAFTHCADNLSFEGYSELSALADVRVLMRDGKVAVLLDRLPHENTPEKMQERAEKRWEHEELDNLFDQATRHYQRANRVYRLGPNSGRSPESMTRRVTIIDSTGGIGTLEVSTIMVNAAETRRYLTWTSNTIAKSRRPSTVRELHSLEDILAVIDGPDAPHI